MLLFKPGEAGKLFAPPKAWLFELLLCVLITGNFVDQKHGFSMSSKIKHDRKYAATVVEICSLPTDGLERRHSAQGSGGGGFFHIKGTWDVPPTRVYFFGLLASLAKGILFGDFS